MIGSGRLASPITVRPFLGEHDLGGGATWPAYLARLAAEASPPIAARDYALTIRDLAVRRQMVVAVRDLEAQAFDRRSTRRWTCGWPRLRRGRWIGWASSARTRRRPSASWRAPARLG
jgi:replicative DNA helicase